MTAQEIISLVASEAGLTVDEMLSKSNAPRYSWPRQVAMYLVMRRGRIIIFGRDCSYVPAEAAKAFHRDSSTVRYGETKVQEQIDTDAAVKISIQALAQRCAAKISDKPTEKNGGKRER